MTEIQFDAAKIINQDGLWLCLRVRDTAMARAFVMSCKGLYTAILKKFTKPRSLDANAYAWVLLGKLAAVTRIPKNDIYRNLITEIGDNFEMLPIKNEAVEAFAERWGHGRIGWVVEVVGPSKLKGYTTVCAYYGSSVYDSRQMSRLIDLIVQECKQQDIETLTPMELERMKEEWPCTKKQK